MILTLYLSQEVIGGALVIVPHADFKGLLSQLNTQVKIQVTCPPPIDPQGVTTPYLLQEDVFVDDGLVPLRVQAPACMFGSSLVFSTGGEEGGGHGGLAGELGQHACVEGRVGQGMRCTPFKG